MTTILELDVSSNDKGKAGAVVVAQVVAPLAASAAVTEAQKHVAKAMGLMLTLGSAMALATSQAGQDHSSVAPVASTRAPKVSRAAPVAAPGPKLESPPKLGSSNPAAPAPSGFGFAFTNPNVLKSDPSDDVPSYDIDANTPFMGDDSICADIISAVNAIRCDPSNVNLYKGYFNLLQQVNQYWPQDPSEQSQLQSLLSQDVTSDNGGSMGSYFAQLILDQTWNSTGGSFTGGVNATQAALTSALSSLQGLGNLQGCGFVQNAIGSINHYLSTSGGPQSPTYLNLYCAAHWDPITNLPALVQQGWTPVGGGQPITVYVDFGPGKEDLANTYEMGTIGNFTNRANISQWLNQFNSSEVQYLCSHVKNKELLLQLLYLYVLHPQNQTMTQNTGGVAHSMDALSDAQKQLNNVLNEFETGVTPGASGTNGTWSNQSAVNFMTALANLQLIADNNPNLNGPGGIGSIIDEALGGLVSIQSPSDSAGNPVVPPVYNPTTGQTLSTLGDLFTDYMQSERTGNTTQMSADATAMAGILTAINPNVPTGGTSPSPTQFATFTQSVQSLNQAISSVQDQSQLTSTTLNSVTNIEQQDLAMLKSIGIDSLVGMIKAIIQNSKAA